MTTKIYIKIEDLDFQHLVQGREVIIGASLSGFFGGEAEIHILLSDIGYRRMLQHIDDAMNNRDPHAS